MHNKEIHHDYVYEELEACSFTPNDTILFKSIQVSGLSDRYINIEFECKDESSISEHPNLIPMQYSSEARLNRDLFTHLELFKCVIVDEYPILKALAEEHANGVITMNKNTSSPSDVHLNNFDDKYPAYASLIGVNEIYELIYQIVTSANYGDTVRSLSFLKPGFIMYFNFIIGAVEFNYVYEFLEFNERSELVLRNEKLYYKYKGTNFLYEEFDFELGKKITKNSIGDFDFDYVNDHCVSNLPEIIKSQLYKLSMFVWQNEIFEILIHDPEVLTKYLELHLKILNFSTKTWLTNPYLEELSEWFKALFPNTFVSLDYEVRDIEEQDDPSIETIRFILRKNNKNVTTSIFNLSNTDMINVFMLLGCIYYSLRVTTQPHILDLGTCRNPLVIDMVYKICTKYNTRSQFIIIKHDSPTINDSRSEADIPTYQFE